MAKTRSRSRKTRASAARATKRTKKTAARPKTSSAKRQTSTDKLDFKMLRRDIDKAIAVIARRLVRVGQPSAKLSETQTVLTRWANDIDQIICDPNAIPGDEPCGPTMLLDLS